MKQILLLLYGCILFCTFVTASDLKLEARNIEARQARRTTLHESSTHRTTVSGSSPTAGVGEPLGDVTSSITTAPHERETATSISVDPRLPAGGVSMIMPAITDSETYVKVGDYATFSWNYTSLVVEPTAVNVEAYCSVNDFYYPIASNISVKDTKVVWNTSDYQATATVKLIVAAYTLNIYDAQADLSVPASAGHLALYDSLKFGVYTPQAYTPLDSFKCATCSGGFSNVERSVIHGTLMMAGIMATTTIFFIMR
ncbi:hypothetical protein V1512DRAFT_260967 [Lipomyces arxii]|uniref:uncharacterized protein n=1 Tax=Lipomyces arxii TaxID=56418 RepID=UPI0034CD47FE